MFLHLIFMLAANAYSITQTTTGGPTWQPPVVNESTPTSIASISATAAVPFATFNFQVIILSWRVCILLCDNRLFRVARSIKTLPQVSWPVMVIPE
jgi:hypothetical protein